jgi:C-terminal processing protease CtpA/Prc
MYLAILLSALLLGGSTHGYTGINRAGDSVYKVHKNSPADRAGIKVNDKILLIDGHKKGDIDGPAGINVELDIKRGDQMLHFTVPRVPHDEAYK